MALRSMTGYGRGECFINDRKCVVEIKSVNHRYSDLTIKLPRTLNSLEDKLKKQLSAEIFRGKTDVYVTFESFSSDDIKITANVALADAYVAEMRKLSARYELAEDISLSVLTRLPDVFSVEKNTQDDRNMSEIWELLSESAALACGQFCEMRDAEGTALKKDILKKK